eukprot:8369651-Pyramimonas_sp.AAC.1
MSFCDRRKVAKAMATDTNKLSALQKKLDALVASITTTALTSTSETVHDESERPWTRHTAANVQEAAKNADPETEEGRRAKVVGAQDLIRRCFEKWRAQ